MSNAKPALRIGVAAMMLITVLAAGLGAAAPAPAPADSSEAISPAEGPLSGTGVQSDEVCGSYTDDLDDDGEDETVEVCYQL